MDLFNIKFVGEVEKYPELYDYTLVEYSRKDFTARAWNSVAKEVSLTAEECKEKWRNLRSTLVKNVKPTTKSGSTKKRPYYLAEAMQFAIPFLRVSSGTLHEKPAPSPDDTAINESKEIFVTGDIMFSEAQVVKTEKQSNSVHSPSPSPPQSPPQSAPVLVSGRQKASVSSPETVPKKKGLRGPHGQPIRKRKAQNLPSDSRESSAETATNSSKSSANERKEGIQNFLNSLLPDLVQLNDVQLRIYKRKALLLIDEVTGTLDR